MAVATERLIELKSAKAQLEVGLIYLKRKHAELQKRMSSQEFRRSRVPSTSQEEMQRQADEIAEEIERRRAAIDEIAEKIQAVESRPPDDGVEQLVIANDRLGEGLSSLRAELLQSLRALAGPLQHYREIVDRKTELVKQIGILTKKDQAYANYIECALLRQSEYEDDLKTAVEMIKRLRVVA